jgi:hypothetical protein
VSQQDIKRSILNWKLFGAALAEIDIRLTRLDKPPSGQRQHVRADVDAGDLAGRADKTRCHNSNCPCPCAKVENPLTRLQITTPDYVLDDGGKSRVHLAQVELGDSVPHTDLPFEASSLGVGVHNWPPQ